jgi:hypothetical protein
MSTKVVSMKNVDQNAILQAVYSKGRVSGGLRALSRGDFHFLFLSISHTREFSSSYFLFRAHQ